MTGCACTKTELFALDPDGAEVSLPRAGTLLPGALAYLRTRLDVREKRGSKWVSIEILDREGEECLLSLSVGADVIPFFDVESTLLEFGDLRPGEMQTRFLDIFMTDRSSRFLELDENAVRGPFAAELAAVSPDADGLSSQWRLEVRAGPTSRLGNHHEQISVHARLEGVEREDHPRLRVSARAAVEGDLRASPRSLQFGNVDVESRATEKLILRRNSPVLDLSKLTFRLVGREREDGGYEPLGVDVGLSTDTRVVRRGEKLRVHLTVELPARFQGSYRGTLLVESPGSPDPLHTIPFSGFVRD